MKRRIKTATLMAGVGAMLCFAGCGGAQRNVATNVIDHLKSFDMDGVKQYAVDNSSFERHVNTWKGINADSELDKKGKEVLERFKKKLANAKYTIGAVTVDGDKANISIKIDDEEQIMVLLKVGEQWKVKEFDF